MLVKVRLFAGLAEALGAREVTVSVPDGARPADLKAALARQYPQASALIERALVAVDREYADEQRQLSTASEIALIPPVGGGDAQAGDNQAAGTAAPASPADWPDQWLTAFPLQPDDAWRRLCHPAHGGVVVFAGTVREWTGQRQTLYLEYEAYGEMALAKMRAIADDVKRRWPGVQTVMWHRIGRLHPKDVAVVCAASAPHREEAFAAARALIERLKAEVPIWKKEYYADGDPEWRANEQP
ncbi:MAG: molybdenum cofactor biosynthesis protein MoaE [Alicyclobacillaceae bacterium]|nr:molybdenum cofactor biosynthesis protein MoaE [Alicyclobacillaceae bacterium]